MDDAPDTSAAPWLALTLAAPPTPALCARLRAAFPDPRALGAVLAAALGGAGAAEARAARARLAAPTGPLAPDHVAALASERTARRVDAALAWADADPTRHLVTLAHPAYPAALAAIDDPPPLLYLHGAPAALAGPAVALVGSRDATHAGLERARQLGAGLAAAGVVVASGLALGIDGAAHAGALDVRGTTLAFGATGIDIVYPRRHAALAERLLDAGGALATEFALGRAPVPRAFPQRNRLISGTSLATVTVEAALPSGTLTTARHALDQGREVMAVPGAIDNPKAAGCHALIRDGATLVTSTEEILAALALPLGQALATAGLEEGGGTGTPSGAPHAAPAGADGMPPGLGPTERRVWRCLGSEPLPLERLIARSGLPVATLLGALGTLELDGLAVAAGGGRYARCPRG